MGHYDRVEKGNYCRALLRVSDGRRTNRSRFSYSPTRARMISSIHSPHPSIGGLHGSRKYTNPLPCIFYSVVYHTMRVKISQNPCQPSHAESPLAISKRGKRATHRQTSPAMQPSCLQLFPRPRPYAPLRSRPLPSHECALAARSPSSLPPAAFPVVMS